MRELKIWSNGATGNIELNIENEIIKMALSTGSLNIDIHGETNNLSAWTTSYANVYLLNLSADKVNIRNNSPMDCYVNVSNTLNAKVEYSGNIYYKGDPGETEIVEAGSGRVLKIN